MKKLRIALLQMKVIDDKNKNLAKAENYIKKAVEKEAELVMLPEMFNCPYQNEKFPEYAEKVGGKTWRFLSELAKEKEIYLVGGSIPEKDDKNNIYNTSYVFNKNGEQIAKHRKIHLFDIDIENGQTFKESATLSAGDSITTFDTPYGKMGVVICYDLRFPELSAFLSKKGVNFILVPGAFNMTTGPAHWELLFRSRALDNQVYTIGAAPARDESQNYVSYGNSIIVSPWGKVLKRLDGEEDILIANLDIDYLDKIRQELPLLKHKRYDIY
ncbi:MAG: carbon-nitrogen hydrolase family protein [Bacillota bacterium]